MEGRECDGKETKTLAWEESLSVKETASLYSTNRDNTRGLRSYVPIVGRLYYIRFGYRCCWNLKGLFELESQNSFLFSPVLRMRLRVKDPKRVDVSLGCRSFNLGYR
jgi:hypothetical protein